MRARAVPETRPASRLAKAMPPAPVPASEVPVVQPRWLQWRLPARLRSCLVTRLQGCL